VEKVVQTNIKINIAVQINGKTRHIIEVDKNINKDMVIKKIKDNEKIKKYLTDQNIQKEIYVPGKILNFVL
jgi:Leucyl-tRNA synthetase